MSGTWSLDHCSLTVPHLDQAVHFFTAVVGAELAYRRSFNPGSDVDTMRISFGAHSQAGFELAKLTLGSVGIELFEYTAPDQRTDPPRNCDVGGSHLAFLVDDIEVAVRRAAAHPGVRLLGKVQCLAETHPLAGRQWVYLLTPWQQQLELVSNPQRD